MKKQVSKILLLDDEELNLKMLKRYFNRPYHELVLISDSEKAVGALREGDWAGIITDLRMPKLNGIDILREAKKYNQDIVRIMITAFANTHTLKLLINENLTDYILEKPFSKEEITLLMEKYFTPEFDQSHKDLTLSCRELWSGLLNLEDVVSVSGVLLVSAGTYLDILTIEKLRVHEKLKGEEYKLNVRHFFTQKKVS